MDKKVRNRINFLGAILAIGLGFISFPHSAQAYANTSTSTSAVIQISDVSYGSYPKLGTFSWNETKPANTYVTFRVRAGNVLVPDGTWSAWTATANGGSLSAFNGNKYVQYEATLSSDDISIVPMVNDISVTSGGPFVLTSSPYNTTASTSTLNSMTWSETLPGSSDAVFQVRTSPDNSTWTSWMGPDGTSSSVFTDPAGGESMPAGLRDGANDQWIQYKMFLLSDLTNTPTVSQVQMNYNSLVPVISSFSVTPNTGNTTKIYDIPYQTEYMTINGSDFVTGATVTLIKGATNVSATSVNVVSANQITCQFNSSQTAYGNWDLKVTNANGASVTSTAALESVNVVPAITSISASPNNGNPAQIDGTDVGNVTLTVNGSSFVTGATVKIVNTVTAAEVSLTGVNVASGSLITATLDPTLAWSGTWSVVVTNINSATGTLTGGLTIINKSISTSAVLDLTEGKDFSSITWTDSTPSGTTTALEMRAGNVLVPDGTWTSWAAVTKGQDLGSSIDGKRYVQYRATLRASNINNISSIQDITLSYVYYPTGSFQLLGSPYNAGASDNILASIQWAESTASGTTDVKFQIRTAPDNGSGAPNWTSGSKWCGPTSCAATTGDTDYASSWYNSVPAGENVNAVNSNGSGDQWMQYSAWLDTNNSGQTPILSQVQLNYAVNSQPMVSAVTASENTDGTISIGYTLADSDSVGSDETVAASADLGITFTDNPLLVGASTINLAGNYSYLPTGSQTVIIESEQITCTSRSGAVLSCVGGRGANQTTAVQHTQSGNTTVWAKALTTASGDNIGAGQSVGSGKHITWTIKSDFDGVYNATGKIRVTANDGNIANQVGNGDSSTFVIDSNNPASPTIYLDRSASAGNVSAKIGITGDAGDSLSYVIDNTQLYNITDNCAGTACACFGGATTPAGYEAFVIAHSLSWANLNTNPKTFSFTDNNDDARKICVLYKDQFNNYSTNNENLCNGTVCNYAVTPQNPYAFKYYDTSNPDTSDYRLVLSWGVPVLYGEGKENTYNGFDVYQIYWCHQDKNLSDCTNFTAHTTKAKTDNYITDSGLSNSDKYCYKYKIKDHPADVGGTASDYSKWSDALCAVPGAGGSSLSKNISVHSTSVPSGTLYATQATINWDTYDAQDPNTLLTGSNAVYWRDKTLNEQTWNYFSPSGYSEHHSVTIPGGQLTPAHLYEYRVYSQSLWGTEVYYKTSAYDTFQTLAGPVISNIQSVDVGNSSATITWDTDISASSELYYATSYLNGQLVNPDTGTCPSGNFTSHSCTISGRNPGTTYYFSVKSVKEGDANAFAVQNYDITGAFLHFTTTVDYTLPVITPGSNPLILTDTQAALGWSTDKKTQSWILWGTGSHPTPPYTAPIANFDPANSSHNPYQHYQANSNADLSHTFVMSLGSLTPDTDYFYRMASQDTSGNVTVSGESIFRTLPIQVDHAALVNATHDTVLTIAQYSDTEAVVTFNAGTTATSKLCYATSSGIDIATCAGETPITNSKIHTYHLSGLTPGTPYFVKMKLTDSDNALDTFIPNEKTFTTEAIQVDHIALVNATHDTDPTVTMKTDTEADVYFNAGTTANSKLCYDTVGTIDMETCVGQTAITNSKIHTYHLSGLTPDTPYFVRMKLIDSDNAGDTYVTGEINFTMLELQEPHHALTNPGDPVVDIYTDTEATVHLPAANTESLSKLCYGTSAITDGQVATCAHHADVTDETMTHYYVLSGLTPDTTYHLKSKISDADNVGIDFYSASAPDDITFTTQKIQVDQHAALGSISTPGSSDITKSYNYAYVKWTTDQLANQTLSCGTTPGTHNLTVSDPDSYNTAHALKLTPLSPNTDYFCIVTSTDDLPSPTTLTSGEFTFKTDKLASLDHDPLASITHVTESVITDTNAAVTFDTDQSALCLAEVTTSSSDYGNPAVDKEDGYDQKINYNLHHTIILPNLLFNTNYYYKLTCEDNLGTIVAEQVDAQHTFKTLEQQSDHPVLTNPGSPEVTQYSDTEAIVTLPATNTTSTSKLCWAESEITDMATCTDHQEITTPTKTHSYHLTGLTPNTIYYIKTKVTDEFPDKNNVTQNYTSADGNTFQTLEIQTDHPDLIDPGAPTVTQYSDTEAIISIPTTNTSSTSKLCYDTAEITDMDNCTNHSEILTPTRVHSFHISGLTASTPYHIRTKVTDSENTGIEFTSTDATFTTQEQQYGSSQIPAGDTTAPVISNVSTGTITGESVTITWDTDEKANSLVQYGIKSGVYDSGGSNNDVNSDVTNYVDAHSVIINNLVPGTKYYYKAMSNDAAGNISTSPEQTFTTKATSTLSSIKISSTKLGEALVTWSTSQKTTSIVDYGVSTTYGQSKADTTMATTHSIDISGLTQNTEYHFRVEGKDANNNIYSSGDYTFTPKSPPAISAVKVASTDEHSATISFTTSVPTDALINYQPASSAGEAGSQGKPDLLTAHEIVLKNLASGVTYQYTITAKDYDGNSSTDPSTSSGQAPSTSSGQAPSTSSGQAGSTRTFTTGVDTIPPKIDQVRTDSALAQNDKVQTIISWTTDELANTGLIYKEGQGAEPREVKISDNPTTNHIAVITIFKPGTVYYFKVKSTDLSNNSATSSDFALLTPKRKENIIQIIISNFQDIFGWAKF